ncbi:sec-independent translocase [Actinopolymorpha sp. B17G11]|uniref:sec-independent translocase n=1 Tax=unclassified Actinopolymorpha TaxID=2627063 RepID=UPI0032D8CE1D
MFDIGALEFVVLAVAALFIFGPDRLPDIARQAARGLRQVRNMAANARRELSRELGPEFEDLDIRDLNPRNFVRKHVLDDLDEDDLRIDRDLDIRDDLRVDDKPAKSTTSKVNGSTNGSGTTSKSGTSDGDVTVATPEGVDAGAEGTDTLVDTAPAPEADAEVESQTGADHRPVTVPPFDTEAT